MRTFLALNARLERLQHLRFSIAAYIFHVLFNCFLLCPVMYIYKIIFVTSNDNAESRFFWAEDSVVDTSIVQTQLHWPAPCPREIWTKIERGTRALFEALAKILEGTRSQRKLRCAMRAALLHSIGGVRSLVLIMLQILIYLLSYLTLKSIK